MKKSSILRLKSQFFISRAITYASFLLIPIWVPKLIPLSMPFQMLMITVYVFFISSQWFLLGKEIDHRFKIYYKVNSSIDRVVYRLILGKMTMLIYFGLLGLLPVNILKHFYWGTWTILGLFYSWPTRGKIIEETISRQFIEFKFLDAFEKTVFGIIILFFLFSIPKFPSLENIEAIKLYLDPSENVNSVYWNFISVNYFPFQKFPQLLKLAWCLHYYLVEVGLLLLTFYIFLRLFISRRLSLFGIFALITSWSFSKILNLHLGEVLTSIFSLLWIWSTLWCVNSSTYRSGIFLGLIGLWGTVIHQIFFFLLPIQIVLIYTLLLPDKTYWYKRQMIKYTFFGLFLSLLVYLSDWKWEGLYLAISTLSNLGQETLLYINQKAFFSLSFIGTFMLLIAILKSNIDFVKQWGINFERLKILLCLVFVLFIFSQFLAPSLFENFTLLWILTFLSLFPLEWPLQAMRRVRSKYNLIYTVYILICILDSHFEGRVKIFLDIIKN